MLLQKVVSEALQAVEQREASLCWQRCDERLGFYRVWAQFPLNRDTFDQLFNGRAGYRAQYYLSPEEGALFNRYLVEALLEPVRCAYNAAPLEVSVSLMECSLLSPHAKVWVYRDQEAFDDAAPDTLNPPRWVDAGANRGRRAPLPDHYKLDLKGSFIHPETREFWVDELKLERPCDLFRSGFA